MSDYVLARRTPGETNYVEVERFYGRDAYSDADRARGDYQTQDRARGTRTIYEIFSVEEWDRMRTTRH
jgi:hypothetical protein